VANPLPDIVAFTLLTFMLNHSPPNGHYMGRKA